MSQSTTLTSKRLAFAMACFVGALFSFAASAFAGEEWEKAIEFRDKFEFREPRMLYGKPNDKPWTEADKKVVRDTLPLIHKYAPGLLARVTAYRPLLLYRITKFNDFAAAVNMVEVNAILIPDPFFKKPDMDDAADVLRWTNYYRMMHEMTHLADWWSHVSHTSEWLDLIDLRMEGVYEDMREQGVNFRSNISYENDRAFARMHGLPSTYASVSCEEALADCLARMLAKEYTPPPEIKAFLERELLSTPFKPEESAGALHRGRTLLELGKSEEAMKTFNGLLAKEPNNGFAYWFRGNVWQQEENLDEAIKDYGLALKFAKSRLCDIHEDRGDAYREKKDFNRAIDDYTFCIESRSAIYLHYRKRSNTHRANGSLLKAIADNRPVESFRDDSPLPQKERSSWLIENETDKAIAKFTAAIKLQPDYFRPFALRAKAWQKKGDLDKTLADYDEAIQIQPKVANLHNDRAVVWQAKGDLDEAIADYGECISLEPKKPLFYTNRSLAWNAKGESDKALADCEEAIRLNPDYMPAYRNRGYSYRKKGQYDKCIADYQKVLAKDIGNHSVRDGLAEVLSSCPDEQLRDGKLAVFLATIACEATQWKKASYLDTLAAAYAETGDFEKAVEFQQKALELYPEPERMKWAYLVEQYKSKKPYREE